MVSAQARFISLQNEIREADAAVLKERGDIEWFGAELSISPRPPRSSPSSTW
jgi:hypothetical protein